MRILVISHEFPPIGGGGANACYYLTRDFSRRGHEVTIITANYQGLPSREIIDGVEVLRVPSKRKNQEHCSFGEMFDYLMKAWPVAKQKVKCEKYDICQIFFGIPSGPIGYLLKKKYRLPYVIRFGGGDIPGFQARFDIIYKLIAPFIKVIWKNADYLVANSAGLRELAYGFYDKKEIKIITNGVNTDKYFPMEHSGNFTNLLFVSRLIERKGLQFLLPQIGKIVRECSEMVHLTIVGDGPYRSVLEDIVNKENIGQYVSFAGYKNKEQIVAYYQKADIFVLPSKKEGMPNVVLEAMACGLPIVMSPCEGSAELIRGNGLIAPPEQLAQDIIRLCNDKELRIQMGIESRKMAVEQFGWEKTGASYSEIYKAILS